MNTETMKSIAIFGGTFNPIHYGHLAIAEEIRGKFNLDKIIFVPTFISPHKDSAELADARQRTIMTYLATVSNPCFEVSTVEVDRGGKSYTIDTIKHFRQVYGEKDQLYFILGADMLMEVSSWKNVEELLKICRFIAVPRPGYDIQKIFDQYFLASSNFTMAADLLENIIIENIAMLDISASDIRRRVREWKSIKYMLPEPVEQYIHNQQLYL
jgi:nicotinate-nucleotide adenylyltransferase